MTTKKRKMEEESKMKSFDAKTTVSNVEKDLKSYCKRLFDLTEIDPVFDLSAEELRILRKFVDLATDWGYWSGPKPDFEHVRFELQSHECCRSLQEYSDILFRNLR